MGKAENAVRTELKNISIRRNQIVHEGDYITSNTSRQSIEKADVDEVIDFIELLTSLDKGTQPFVVCDG